jgi:protein SCO1/2
MDALEHEDERAVDGGLGASPRLQVIAIAVVAVVVLGAGVTIGLARRDGGQGAPTGALDIAVEAPQLVLSDTSSAPFDLPAKLSGKITLLYLGYANCPDVCPITTGVLSRTVESLPDDITSRLQVLFVTVDPQRDDPAAIRQFLDNFDRSFIGLSATAEQLRTLQTALRAAFATAEPPTEDGYLVGHVTAVYVFEPDGVARGAYAFGTRQSDWTRILTEVAGRWP